MPGPGPRNIFSAAINLQVTGESVLVPMRLNSRIVVWGIAIQGLQTHDWQLRSDSSILMGPMVFLGVNPALFAEFKLFPGGETPITRCEMEQDLRINTTDGSPDMRGMVSYSIER